MKVSRFLSSSALFSLASCYQSSLKLRDSPANLSLPIIDLGYVKQQASYYNSTGGFYIFSNIRFAAPPLGERRFRAPEKPLVEVGVSDGTQYNDTVCHQYIGENKIPRSSTGGLERGSEDCLFLDVYVPEEVLDSNCQKAPVLGWWHGGAYTVGAKDFLTSGNPSGLLARAKEAGEPMIYVAANYRLGMFGWLFLSEDGQATPNVGLHDALAGMEWVGKHIGKFGGDKDQFTIMGESAGGGIVTLALASYGGNGTVPFQRAISQSAAWFPENLNDAENGRAELHSQLYAALNCTTFSCVQNSSSSALLAAHRAISSEYLLTGGGDVAMGPVPDGEIIPDEIAKLLTSGRVHKIESVITSQTRHEAAGLLTNTYVTDSFLEEYLRLWLPSASNDTIDHVLELYPDDGSELGAYNRLIDCMTDYLFACPARWLSNAYSSENEIGNSTGWKYIFNLGTAGHGGDISYTFGPEYFSFVTKRKRDVAEDSAYDWHQQAIINYVLTGKPGSADVWPEYGLEKQAVWLNETGLAMGYDPWAVGNAFADEICAFYEEKKQFL